MHFTIGFLFKPENNTYYADLVHVYNFYRNNWKKDDNETVSEGRNDQLSSSLAFASSDGISIFSISMSQDRLIVTIGAPFTYNACDNDCGRSYHDIIVQGLTDLEEEISKIDITNGESLFGNTLNVTINAISTTFGAISIYKERDAIVDCRTEYATETCNDSPGVHAWDEGVAFCSGYEEGQLGDNGGSKGMLLH